MSWAIYWTVFALLSVLLIGCIRYGDLNSEDAGVGMMIIIFWPAIAAVAVLACFTAAFEWVCKFIVKVIKSGR